MSNSLLYFIAIILLTILTLVFLPWWATIIVATFPSIVFKLKRGPLIGWAMIGGFVAWLGYALYFAVPNEFYLTEKIGNLLGDFSVFLLLVITGLCGAISSGLGAWVGSSVQQLKK